MDSKNTGKQTKDNESALDKLADKTKEVLGDGVDSSEEEETFQDTPDEGAGDVPQGDKVITDHRTGEKTVVKNTGKRY
ncbi:hypothetical protein [Planococcus salinus]|uniref:Uncharacterized protein n=1 Tax=Planococcus salinus TaxID=1848460 RepID=A0A3M8PE69_9BACL|nr:hypothetical protein [Planococcus salinus]RNF41150.1 hypothetical protein EEX84_02025 [Planococcus salinus]